MRLKGSATVYIECVDCGVVSLPFRIYFCEEDGMDLFNSSNIPEDWAIEDECVFYEEVVPGYCPKHKAKDG